MDIFIKAFRQKDIEPIPGSEISDWWDMVFKHGTEQTFYTYDPSLFHSERWARDVFTYKLKVPQSGDYVVITQHMEVI